MKRGVVLFAILIASVQAAVAGEPEYMRLHAQVGLGIEAKGDYSSETGFVVDDVVRLPAPRSPKLRGELLSVASDRSSVVMFGQEIRITERTEFEGGTIDDLRSGLRAEISCSVSSDDGSWRARSVSLADVKASDKIKGTITKVEIDGTPPDAISISGLRLILIEATDFEEAASEVSEAEQLHFGQLVDPTSVRAPHLYRSRDGRNYVSMHYRQNLRNTSQFDLSDNFDSDYDTTQPELRANWFGFWNPKVQTYVQARFRQQFVLENQQNLEDPDSEVQLTQAYLLLRRLLGDRLALKIGRQDFDEEREWLYDDYLDAARAIVFARPDLTFEVAYIHAVDPLKEKFETWTDLLVKSDWWWREHHRLAGYVLRRWDSDEVREREPLWVGARSLGELAGDGHYWVDFAIQRGNDKHEELRAWAIDMGVTLQAPELPLEPAVTLGYALGSGDETGSDRYEESFRQTGYEDNTGRLGGRTSVHYYGTVLDPELSNIRIFTLGLAARPTRKSSVELLYHRYRQEWPDDGFRSDLIAPPAVPTGQDEDLGWGTDLVFGLPKLWGRVRSSVVFGYFDPGPAFGARQESAFVTRISMSVGIG